MHGKLRIPTAAQRTRLEHYIADNREQRMGQPTTPRKSEKTGNYNNNAAHLDKKVLYHHAATAVRAIHLGHIRNSTGTYCTLRKYNPGTI